MFKWRWFKPASTQLELPLARQPEPDRNRHMGGRSFYFFDFDDNVAFLTTPTFLFHRETKRQVKLSSRELALHSGEIGRSGLYKDFFLDDDPVTGSFRCFRDKDIDWLARMRGKRQIFVEDLAAALGLPDVNWKGPSWNCFYHAVFNARPMALITARGHSPATMRAGIRLWVREGHLPHEPNYLGLYPVSHPATKRELDLPGSTSIPHLKQRALRAAVEKAFRVYGYNPHHRFGMSDDDPRNIAWITDEMKVLKTEYPDVSFFIIQTHGEQMIKYEVFPDHVVDQCLPPPAQLSLFDE